MYEIIPKGTVTFTTVNSKKRKQDFSKANPALAKYEDGTRTKPKMVTESTAKALAKQVKNAGGFISRADAQASMKLSKEAKKDIGKKVAGNRTTTLGIDAPFGTTTVDISYPSKVPVKERHGTWVPAAETKKQSAPEVKSTPTQVKSNTTKVQGNKTMAQQPRKKRESSRPDNSKGLGVTFMKQGIKGPMATKQGMGGSLKQYNIETKSTNIVPKTKPNPPAKKSDSTAARTGTDYGPGGSMAPKTNNVPVGGSANSAKRTGRPAPTSSPVGGSANSAMRTGRLAPSGRDKANQKADAFLKKYREDEANKALVRKNADEVIGTVLALSAAGRRVGQAVFNVARKTSVGRTAEKYITEGAKRITSEVKKLSAPPKKLPAPNKPPPKPKKTKDWTSSLDGPMSGRFRPNNKPKTKTKKDWTSDLDGPMSGRFRQAPRTKVRGGVKPGSKKKKPFTVENDPWQYMP